MNEERIKELCETGSFDFKKEEINDLQNICYVAGVGDKLEFYIGSEKHSDVKFLKVPVHALMLLKVKHPEAFEDINNSLYMEEIAKQIENKLNNTTKVK